MEKPPRPDGIPFDFVLDELDSVNPVIGRMFGCFSVYVDEKIVLILRDRTQNAEDNGVWIATTSEHHNSLAAELPSMRSIGIFGPGPSGWQMIPIESDDFDRDVLYVCKLIRRRDPRIGKVPARKKPKKNKKISRLKKPRSSRQKSTASNKKRTSRKA